MADYSSYIASNRRRLEAAIDGERAQAALTVARALARSVHEQLGARRVVLFGSLARGRFGPHSDIDIAVEGVELKLWYRALRLADQVTEFEVSLFPFEDAPDHVRRAIDRDGIQLWPA